MKTNSETLIKLSVLGEIISPTRRPNYRITSQGSPLLLPGAGGITYNIRVGDKACGWTGDHVEPGVSIKNTNEDANRALNLYSCIGNRAEVTKGEAKGAKGIVTAKHGGVEHILVWFPKEVLPKLAIGDKIQIVSYGQGLKLLDLLEVSLFNLDPELLAIINPEIKNNSITFPITQTFDSSILGSGLGGETAASGDVDLTFQEAELPESATRLRLGDFVCIENLDSRYGRAKRKGYSSIGVISHTDCLLPGHGPGVTIVATGESRFIKTKQTETANLTYFLSEMRDEQT